MLGAGAGGTARLKSSGAVEVIRPNSIPGAGSGNRQPRRGNHHEAEREHEALFDDLADLALFYAREGRHLRQVRASDFMKFAIGPLSGWRGKGEAIDR